MPEKQMLEQTFFLKKHPDTHQPNDPAEGGRKRKQDIYCRRDPLCESIVITILGLVESGDSLSKDGKDSLGGTTGLEGEKERV